jgi:hypothetical protein
MSQSYYVITAVVMITTVNIVAFVLENYTMLQNIYRIEILNTFLNASNVFRDIDFSSEYKGERSAWVKFF